MRLPIQFAFLLTCFAHVFCSKDPHIVIIGAGAAGIAAATRLYQNGFKNLTILEAEDRIGGRIYSVKVDEAYIDLGAQWCHGEKNNVVYDLAKDLDVLKSDDVEGPIYHSKRKLLDEEFSSKLYQIFDTVYGDVPVDYQGSLGEYLIERYNDEIRATWEDDSDKIELAEECLDLFEARVESYEAAFSWFDAAGGGTYEMSEGDPNLSWEGYGFKTILEVLMKKFPEGNDPISIDDKILLSKKVKRVSWWSPTKVQVSCTNDTRYTADHVIWTPSLGVLKHDYKTMFTPQLPTEKVTAIKTLGFDATLKVFFHFPDRWWDDDFKAVTLAWAPSDSQRSGYAFREGPKKAGKSWISAMVAILAVPKSPNLLAVWFSGNFIPQIEKLPEETITNGVMFTMNMFLGMDYSNISRPDQVLRKGWYSDPNFRGTYSYESVKSVSMDKPQSEVLSEPILSKDGRPVVLFAGEATNPKHHSTVHGAIESGFREADRLINYYQ